MARQDVSVGGIVYYGYSLEDVEDWSAGLTELKKRMNSAPVSVTSDGLTFIFRYGWMASGNHVFKIEATSAEKGLAFTIFNTGAGNTWAWISQSDTADMTTPHWGGRTSGTTWSTGSTGVSVSAESVSFANLQIIGSATSGKKATGAYLIESNGSLLVFPNDRTSSFTPFGTTLSGSPSSTEAKVSVFGPVHAPSLAGYGNGSVYIPTQTTQPIPYGSYNFSMNNTSGGVSDLRFQGVMMNSSGNAMLFMMADTGASAYDDEE